MRLLVACDEPLVRRGFHDIIAARDGWSVAAEATEPAQLSKAITGGAADVAVLFLPFGDRGGIELVEQLREEADALPLIVMAAYLVEHYASSFLRAGANAFLRRNSEPEEILHAIEAVAAGGTYGIARKAGHGEPPHERLSARELEVFRLLAAGHAPTAIAAMLQLSVKTVSTYRARILEKTGFRSNADIVGYAIRNRLV